MKNRKPIKTPDTEKLEHQGVKLRLENMQPRNTHGKTYKGGKGPAKEDMKNLTAAQKQVKKHRQNKKRRQAYNKKEDC